MIPLDDPIAITAFGVDRMEGLSQIFLSVNFMATHYNVVLFTNFRLGMQSKVSPFLPVSRY